MRYRGLPTRLCVAEPAGMVYAKAWPCHDRGAQVECCSVIEGIGRQNVEPSFQFGVVDEVIEVDDAASIAAMRLLEERLGFRYGGSSGTNLVACLQLAQRMREAGERGSIVTLLCDRGARYRETLYDDAWLHARDIDHTPWRAALTDALETGTLRAPA